MGKIYLTRNRVIETSYEQSILIAKCIMLFPPHKVIKINEVMFRLDEIDIDALKKSRLPQQLNLGIRVKTIDL